jgi:hypothetical protein
VRYDIYIYICIYVVRRLRVNVIWMNFLLLMFKRFHITHDRAVCCNALIHSFAGREKLDRSLIDQ